MTHSILKELERIKSETGLSEHRLGILAARNGRLMERLREGGRVWPETEQQIRNFIASRSSQAGATQ